MFNTFSAIPIRRNKDIVVHEQGDETLVYDLNTNKAFCLNSTSSIIWNACDGNRDIKEIAKVAQKALGKNVTEDHVILAVSQLAKDSLIEGNIDKSVSGMNRREMVKRVGFSSMIALPIITSLVAPKAANAQSACPDADNNSNAGADGCPCIGANDCASACCGTDTGPRICEPVGLKPAGSVCRANCECINSCIGGQCT